jgi:hypothetical protein
MTRVLLISHRDLVETHRRFQGALFREIAKHLDLRFVDWEDGGATESVERYARLAGGELADFDACIYHVRFRLRRAAEPLQWGSYGGLRIWLDTDAWQNFHSGTQQHGRYPMVFQRDRFDLLVCTGRAVTRRLASEGVNAHWLPKGYEEDAFFDLGKARNGVCTFGRPWPSRRALLHRLERASVGVTDVSGPYGTLNERLNMFAGALVCNMPGAIPFNRPGPLGVPARFLHRLYPGFATVDRGIEPMAKTFEVAGAGCAPIIDAIDELADLGFVSGETCLIYQNFKQAEEILRDTDDVELRTIGRRALDLARYRHTFARRGADFARVVRDNLLGTAT